MKILKAYLALALLVACTALSQSPLVVTVVPQYFVPVSWFPPNARYISAADLPLLFPNGVVLRNLVVRNLSLLGPLPALGVTQPYSFSTADDFDFSSDGGTTYQRTHTSASNTVSLYHAADIGDTSYYAAEMQQQNISVSPSFMIRESPTRLSAGQHAVQPAGGGYMISSFFDVFFEVSLDGGGSWTPSLDSLRLTLYYPPEFQSPSPLFFPPLGAFAAKSVAWDARFANGVAIRHLVHDQPLQSFPPPPPGGGTQINAFGARAMFDMSFDNGMTWIPATATTSDQVRVTAVVDIGNTRFFDTEILSLNISGGLPGGVIFRESPTRASTGRLNERLDPGLGQYMISSFFDVFLELSIDGGLTWLPAVDGPLNLELSSPAFSATPGSLSFGSVEIGGSRIDSVLVKNTGTGVLTISAMTPSDLADFSSAEPLPILVVAGESAWVHMIFHPATAGVKSGNVSFTHNGASSPDTIHVEGTGYLDVVTGIPEYVVPHDVFLPNGRYVSAEGTAVVFLNGVGLRDLVTRELPLVSTLPPLGGIQVCSFNVTGDLDLSTDGGMTYQRQHLSVHENVSLNHAADIGSTSYFISEMQSLSFSAMGGVVLVRESPTRASLGQHTVRPLPGGGYMISSFFDVFLEVSVDGGGSWVPAPDSLRLTMYYPPEYQTTGPLFIPAGGRYVSKNADWDAMYAMGIVIRHLVHDQPSASFPLPPPLGHQTNTFTGRVKCDISMDGGMTWVPVIAPTVENVYVADVGGSGGTRVYDTEMLGLSISGGGLPGGVMIRESPTLASTGKLANRLIPGTSYYRMSSFFDVFTEVTFNGGASWYPATSGPMYLELDGQTELDTFPNSRAHLLVHSQSGPPEAVDLAGETIALVHIPPEGTAGDNDQDGLEEVQAEILSMNLTGMSSMGPVVFTLDDRYRTVGEIEETINLTPGVLDVPPFHPFGTAESFFDVFFEVHLGGMSMFGSTPVHMKTVITHKPPAPGETYRNIGPPIVLVDGSGLPTGVLLDSASHTPLPIVPVAISVPLAAGWNIISNPVTVLDDTVGHLYPTSVFGYAFRFTPEGYARDTTMENGVGYWDKFPEAITQTVTGMPITRDTFDVVAGWNMVGSITYPVDTSSIVSIPVGLRRSPWYGYGVSGYEPATHLIPGQGYWVKAASTGQFVLASLLLGMRAGAGSTGVNPADVLSALTITDNKGRSQALYFGADESKSIQPSWYDLPPSPPAGAFDARFETSDGGSMVQTHAVKVTESVEFPVSIQSDAYPLTISWNVGKSTASYELSDGHGGRVFSSRVMNNAGSIKITNRELSRFSVKLVSDGTLPKEFALLQNFPNPFNPETTIKYDLPIDARVLLRVFNILGQEVATLVNDEQKAGFKVVKWSVRNVASGVYFYRLDAGNFTSVKRMMLLK